MPRRPARRPSALSPRAKTPSHVEHDPSGIGQRVSSEEKRQLILAHTAARERRMSWGPGYYVAIAASCLVIVSGWWLTLDKNLRAGIRPGQNPLVQTVKDSARVFDGSAADSLDPNTKKELEREALEATAASIQALIGATSSQPTYNGTLPTARNK